MENKTFHQVMPGGCNVSCFFFGGGEGWDEGVSNFPNYHLINMNYSYLKMLINSYLHISKQTINIIS